MDGPVGKEYYESRKPEILALFDAHAQGWKPLLSSRYGEELTDGIVKEAHKRQEALIPAIPYIGGDNNPMTRHLIRSTTSLALYKAMKSHGKTAIDTGKIIYDAVAASVSKMPPQFFNGVNTEFIAKERKRAQESQKRCYPGDWVWEFVEGDGVEFDYGYDFLECGTQKIYHSHGADEFLPFYCYLDFVTHRTVGWGFARSTTLAEGYEKCDFRWKKGRETRKGWPPPFLKELNK